MYINKRNRLKDFDYSSSNYYYVTICTKGRINWFGRIRNGEMLLNTCGEIVKERWEWLSEQYKYVQLDKFVIMPDHFHGILIINSDLICDNFISVCDGDGVPVGQGRDPDLPGHKRHRILDKSKKIKPLSELIGAFKTTSSKLIHLEGFNQFKWQPSFYDHIIRNEESLYRIRKYIRQNSINHDV